MDAKGSHPRTSRSAHDVTTPNSAPAAVGTHRLRVVDSITELTSADIGSIVVAGSHGGRSSATYALALPLALVVFNDAGLGKDNAGIVALSLLDAAATPCVTVSHASARIGDALDAWEHGRISFVNDAARGRGLRSGQPLRAEILRVFA